MIVFFIRVKLSKIEIEREGEGRERRATNHLATRLDLVVELANKTVQLVMLFSRKPFSFLLFASFFVFVSLKYFYAAS